MTREQRAQRREDLLGCFEHTEVQMLPACHSCKEQMRQAAAKLALGLQPCVPPTGRWQDSERHKVRDSRVYEVNTASNTQHRGPLGRSWQPEIHHDTSAEEMSRDFETTCPQSQQAVRSEKAQDR
mgnify:CR=1 FL=1